MSAWVVSARSKHALIWGSPFCVTFCPLVPGGGKQWIHTGDPAEIVRFLTEKHGFPAPGSPWRQGGRRWHKMVTTIWCIGWWREFLSSPDFPEFLSSPDFPEISGIPWNLGKFGEIWENSGEVSGIQWGFVWRLICKKRWNGHKIFVHKIAVFIQNTKACWKEGSEMLAGAPWFARNALDRFVFVHFEPCVFLAEAYVLMHVFVDSNSRNRNWSLPMSAAISMVRLRTLVSTPFWPPERLFCNGPHLSHLDSHIVNTSQATQRISVYSWPGLG